MDFPKLSPDQTELFLSKVCPLGRIPLIEGSEISFSDTTARRFMLDSSVVNKRPRNQALANKDAFDPKYLSFGFTEALSALIPLDWELYSQLFNVVKALDWAVFSLVMSCEQSAVIVSHRSFGSELFPHIHQRGPKPTLSVFVNLTGVASSHLTLYPPLEETSKAYEKGYTKHAVLNAYIRKQEKTELVIPGDRVTRLVFDASRVPHSYTYTDDVWLTLVYDQIEILKHLETPNVLAYL